MKRLILLLTATAAAVACSACAPEYSYAPVSTTGAVVAGRPAADYPIVPKAEGRRSPAGDVRLTTFGVVTMHRSTEAGGGDVPAVGVRVVLANDGETSWRFDTREQRIALASGEEIAPTFTSVDMGTPAPEIQIASGGRRTVDLFFDLPRPLAGGASKVPAFDVLWAVHAGDRTVQHRTTFDRFLAKSQTEGDEWNSYGWDVFGM
jgi:hypothetical protein